MINPLTGIIFGVFVIVLFILVYLLNKPEVKDE